ncbi:hypothetical protein BCR34DRAFT_100428 [Clohesyomyces aquaticus]|uniref:Knr4/Smi1-like domain-containing protein n=1 Tax=Clohesyomyces aquaticus TaxID=1231657 RepID=A0A1Y1YTB4_9PLEO|nr:hypothetical protein BCR34DRAFT_100428 [Clohesyomyces aquaticus]
MIARRIENNSQVSYLTQSLRAWSLLLVGTLAKLIRMNANKTVSVARDIEQWIRERIRNEKLDSEPIPLRDILSGIETTNQTPDAVAYYIEIHQSQPGTLFRTPATEIEIAQAEERFGVVLPQDYKAFLRLSNRFDAAFNGIGFHPSLDPVGEIRWLKEEETWFTDLMFDLPSIPGCGLLNSTVGMVAPTLGKVL